MLFIHELGHAVVYILVVVVFYKFVLNLSLKSITPLYALIGFLVTMLLDLDHFIDYFIYSDATFNLANFLSGNYFAETQQVFVFFHSWELVIVLFMIILLNKSFNLRRLLQFIVLGISVHLIYDTIYYGFNWYSYFLIVRALNGFSLNVLQ